MAAMFWVGCKEERHKLAKISGIFGSAMSQGFDSTDQQRNYHLADRARAVPANVFAAMDAAVAKARAERERDGRPGVIDLSKANPDLGTPDYIIQEGQRALTLLDNHRYTPFDGKPGFLEAAGQWYRSEHGVAVDPATQIIATVGAIDGLSTLTQVLLNPGDVIAVPDPYYPPYEALAKVAGARLLPLPTSRSTGFLPDLDAVGDDVWRQSRMVLLNYPNNPTGALATREFYERIVALARKFDFLIVNDFAYAGLNAADGSKPVSLLSVAAETSPTGTSDVAIEVVSLSKMYAMAGWRLGFVAAPPGIMAAVRDYHHQMRSFPAGAVQDAGQAALSGDQSSVRNISWTYQARRAVLSAGLRGAGFDVFDTSGALFVWARIPEGRDAEEFARCLLEETGVAVMPGTCFGKCGRGYIRLSLLDSEEHLEEAVNRIAASQELAADLPGGHFPL